MEQIVAFRHCQIKTWLSVVLHFHKGEIEIKPAVPVKDGGITVGGPLVAPQQNRGLKL